MQNAAVGLYEAAKFTIYPSITSIPATDISVNMGRWEELPDDLKAIVEVAAREFAANISAATFLDDQEAVKAIVADGVEIIDWDVEERRKLRAIAAEAMREYAEGSEMAIPSILLTATGQA